MRVGDDLYLFYNSKGSTFQIDSIIKLAGSGGITLPEQDFI